MVFTFSALKSTGIACVFACAASSAFAAGTQPHDPNVTLFAYEQATEHYCPAGTQPIRYNGVVCCGIPNATGYRDAPVVVKRKQIYRKSTPTYSQSQIPLGKSPHSYDGT